MSKRAASEQTSNESPQEKQPSDPAAYSVAIEKGKAILREGGSKGLSPGTG